MPKHPQIDWPKLRAKVRKTLKKKRIKQVTLSKELAVIMKVKYTQSFRHCCSRWLTVPGMRGLIIKSPSFKVQEAFSTWMALTGE